MKQAQKIIDLYLQSLEGFKKLEATPRDFGTGDLLYSSEIHTLQMVSRHAGLNLTELSDKLGVSKSASSKFVRKLIDKKLITKDRVAGNKKEVVFFVTEKGRTAALGHEAFAGETLGAIHQLIEACTEKESALLERFLSQLVAEVKKINQS